MISDNNQHYALQLSDDAFAKLYDALGSVYKLARVERRDLLAEPQRINALRGNIRDEVKRYLDARSDLEAAYLSNEERLKAIVTGRPKTKRARTDLSTVGHHFRQAALRA